MPDLPTHAEVSSLLTERLGCLLARASGRRRPGHAGEPCRRRSPDRIARSRYAAPVEIPARLDCAATLPFEEALTIADSALRSRLVTPAQLAARARDWPARGRQRVARVARHADGRSSEPIESVLRAICLQIPGLSVTPQVRIERNGKFLAIVDLADERLRIVIEAEGFEFHGDREGFDRDCHRYDELVAQGGVVLRFTWEQVMRRDRWVAQILATTVAHRMTLVSLPASA